MGQALHTTLHAPAEAVQVSDFVEAMSALATSVVLVTCEVDGRPWGMTVTAFCSISTEPPTVLVSLGVETTAARAIAHAGRFGVSVLSEGQRALADHGSRPGADKYLERFLSSRGAHGASPVVAGAVGHFDCELTDRIQVADHVLLLGCVRAVHRAEARRPPLLHHRRAYTRLGA